MSAAPLTGIRVVEFGHVAAGPFAGMLLADLGADVVKIEPPQGDHMRNWPPFTADEREFSLNFASVNRNKRSIVANLKDPDDLARVRSLITNADILLENYRPGTLERLGLGYDTVRKNHPQGIVYCSLSGYGQTGPYRDQGAFDVVIQAASGLMSVTGARGGEPVKCGVPVGDFVTGLYAALSMLAALASRQRDGTSHHVDCSMLTSLLGIAALQTSQYWGTGQSPEPLGSAHPRNAPYQGFTAKDSQFVIAAGTDELWRRVAKVVGREDLVDDPRFVSQRNRAQNQEALAAELEPIFTTKPAQDWLDDLQALGVPCSPVNTYADILSDPHINAIELIKDLRLPGGDTTKTIRFPPVISDLNLPDPDSAPALGEGADAVFEEWLQ